MTGARGPARPAVMPPPLLLLLLGIAIGQLAWTASAAQAQQLRGAGSAAASLASQGRALQQHQLPQQLPQQGDDLSDEPSTINDDLQMDPAMRAAISALKAAVAGDSSAAAAAAAAATTTASAAAASGARAVAVAPQQQQQQQQLPSINYTKAWPEGYMAICMIIKNQQKDIREWLEYHRWLGVSKVYLFDNNSTRPLASRITDFMQTGFVDYQFFVGKLGLRTSFKTTKQYWVYNECIQRFSKLHRWIAFIDSDEFIVMHDTAYRRDINGFLRQYEDYGALAVNWVLFGSSGIKQRPHGGNLINYNKCMPQQHEECRHVKVIGNTKYLKKPAGNPHAFEFNDPRALLVNEQKKVLTTATPKTPYVSVKRIALYHYVLKSWEDFATKMARGSPTENRKTWAFFDLIDGQANATCDFAIALGRECCQGLLRRRPEGAYRSARSRSGGGGGLMQRWLPGWTQDASPAASDDEEEDQDAD